MNPPAAARIKQHFRFLILLPLPRAMALLLAFSLPTWGGAVRASESLRKGDAVSIQVFGEEDLSGVFQVNDSGQISFPLLGRLEVSGKTPQAVEEEIERLLEIDLIRDAEVSANLADREVLSVNVIGDVRTPGKIAFPEDGSLDLATAIASAGGLTETSDGDRISIRSAGQQQGVNVSTSGPRRTLRPGDTVIVTSKTVAGSVTILGEVNSPGSVEVPAAGQLDLLTAIARAGGFSPRARPTKVTVRRQSASENVDVETVNVSKLQKEDSAAYLLRAGDVVIVPESIF